jgi:hypothetical protein
MKTFKTNIHRVVVWGKHRNRWKRYRKKIQSIDEETVRNTKKYHAEEKNSKKHYGGGNYRIFQPPTLSATSSALDIISLWPDILSSEIREK